MKGARRPGHRLRAGQGQAGGGNGDDLGETAPNLRGCRSQQRIDPPHSPFFLPRRCEYSSATLWRKTENGADRKPCRDVSENSNAPFAGAADRSGFVAANKPATVEIFSVEKV